VSLPVLGLSCLLLEAKELTRKSFIGGAIAKIDPVQCNRCGRCQEVCRYAAVSSQDGNYLIDPIACEGCAACLYQCPENAIKLEKQHAGEWYISETPYGKFFHAHLYPAQENSGKLVKMVRDKAKQVSKDTGIHTIILDGPPGIGCPVISTITGVNRVIIVTEPTISGLHDMQRVFEIVTKFNIKPSIIINKADLNSIMTAKIRKWCEENGIEVSGELAFDAEIVEAMVQGKSIVEYNSENDLSKKINEIWTKILNQ